MLNYEKMLRDIVTPIVNDPDSIKITVNDSEHDNIVLELSVAPDDMGKVIGKHGRIAKAIRTVIKAAANAAGQKVSVDIK